MRGMLTRDRGGSHARPVAVLLALTALFALGGCSSLGQSPSPSRPQVRPTTGTNFPATGTPAPKGTSISKQEAIAAAEAFLGRKLSNPTVGDPADDPNNLYQVMEDGTGVSLWVGPADGRVVSMLVLGDFAPGVNVTQDEAVKAAKEFLVAHRVDFDGMTMSVEFIDHGAAQAYYITWQRHVGGAAVPDTRQVQVDARTGKVFGFNDFRRPYGSVASPSITRDGAIALATKRSGLTDPEVHEASLMIVPTGDWAGRTVWSVQLSAEVPIPSSSSGYISAFWIYVDAATGETLIYGQG